jgi:hypothetical protein
MRAGRRAGRTDMLVERGQTIQTPGSMRPDPLPKPIAHIVPPRLGHGPIGGVIKREP